MVLAKFLNLTEMETAAYLGNPVVHFETWALVMAYRRNRAIAIELDKMVKTLEDLYEECKKQDDEADWEDVEDE